MTMQKNIASIYKAQIFLAITLSIILIALDTVRKPLDIAMLGAGALLGALVLDLEYFIYAYFLEPVQSFSQNLRTYIGHKDFIGAFKFIDINKNQIKDKSLNSAVFQMVLAPVSIFIVYATVSYFIKALVLSVFANSIFKLMESYFEDTLDEWFWSLKNKPTKQGTVWYAAIMLAVLVYCLYSF